MTIGTPYLAAVGNEPSGTNTLVVTVGAGLPGTPSVATGDCIAVFITTNTAVTNIGGVTDSKGNVYTASLVTDGTNVNGQWFTAPNAIALTGGVDTITATFTGTGGAKTLQAVGCAGVTVSGPVDQSPAGTFGTSTSPLQSVAAGSQANELALGGIVNAGAGGAPVWTGLFAGATFTNSTRNGAAQFASVAALPVTSAAPFDTSATIVSANWAVASLTLHSAVIPVTSQIRVGTTVPNLAFGTGPCGTNPSESCYDAGLSQDQGDNRFIAAVNRSVAGHLTVTKKFWTTVGDYSLSRNNIAKYVTYGTYVLFALTPPLSGGTTADQNALANFLTGIKAMGFNSSNCGITLWQEPEGNTHFGNVGSAQYQAQMAIFGPVVNASGLPLIQDIGMGAGVATATAFANAGYAAPGVFFSALVCDFYYAPWSRGITLDAMAAIADSHSNAFGLGEWGSRIGDNHTGYTNYITQFFQTRQIAGKKGCFIIRYEGQCSATGIGDLTSPLLSNTDARVIEYQNMWDTLTTIGAGNTVTVANPGNKTNNVNDVVNLQITATDSDSSQTLIFSATGLPTGLVISNSGLITGTVTVQGTFNVTVTATDGTGANGQTGFSWIVSPVVTNVITITAPGDQSTQLGAVVNLPMAAIDSNPLLTSFNWGASGLPTGLVISASSGTISGSPTVVGTGTVTVTATDSTGSTGITSFTWTITNPQVLTAGKFVTIPPVNPSPLGGLGIADRLSYEITFGLTAGAGSTLPFCAVTLQFYDFDEAPAFQTPVDTVTWRVPMGTVNDPNGSAVVHGRGPLRGQFMRAQCHNVDSVDAVLSFMQIVGTSREVDRDDWRWDSGGNAPVIPGFTNANAATASLVLGGVSNLAVPHGTTVSRLCSMFAGEVYLRVHLSGGGPANITVKLSPQPSTLFNSQDLINKTIGNAGDDSPPFVLPLPRGACLLSFVGDATIDASVNAEIIAKET